jgi:flagellar biosynthetic protein FlhB
VSVLASALQVGWAYSPKAVEFNWGRLSPASGLSRLAPMQALPELFKAVIGMVVVGTIGYLFIHQVMVQAPALVGMMPRDSAAVIWSDMWTLLWRSTLALIALAAADFGVQRWRWYSQLKMSRQEVREEARSNEGSPEIKARVRRVQRDMARNRMLTLVKTATVVITNPTHVAVALEYRRSEMTAPVVVAKGQDHMAARIREIAREHGVPIVENVTLARALHKSAEIGDTIPADLFGAVAEVLAYLVRLKQLLL